MRRLLSACAAVLLFECPAAFGGVMPMPRVTGQAGHYHMEVDGRPFFVLAAQMHNSSAWLKYLPFFWKAAEALSVNTVQAPVYWETMEPAEGHYDFSMVDTLITQARTHRKRLALLWFGTWKNGAGHYVPLWMKRDTKRFPRLRDADGRQLDGMSPFGSQTLEKDKQAFSALMGHLRKRDSVEHTVIMVQVENEPGLLGTVRDHGPEAEAAFRAPVPANLANGVRGTDWMGRFGNDAAEYFAAWSVSRYVNAVAAAGKAAYPLPFYVNVWLRYRGLTQPGVEYPSGGATVNVLDLWKRETPTIDVIGTDTYTGNFAEYQAGVLPYQRADNAPFLSESGITEENVRWTWDMLSRGALGASVFGVDDPGLHDAAIRLHGADNRLLTQAAPVLVPLAARGDVVSLIEEPGAPSPTRRLGNWIIKASYGAQWGQPDPSSAPIRDKPMGRAVVARLDETHFLVIGAASRIGLTTALHDTSLHEVRRVEQGEIDARGAWHGTRIWNGDETDSGLNLPPEGVMLRVEVSP